MLGEICWKFNPFTYICICIYVHEMIGQTSSVCCVLRKQGWRVSQVFGHFEIVAGQLIISRFSLWWHRWNWVGTGELFPLTSIFQRRTWWWADRSRKGTRNCNLQTSAWKKTVKDGFHQAFVRILAATNTTISMVKVEACSETGETGPPELTKHSTPQRPSDYNFQTFRLLVQRYAEKKTHWCKLIYCSKDMMAISWTGVSYPQPFGAWPKGHDHDLKTKDTPNGHFKNMKFSTVGWVPNAAELELSPLKVTMSHSKTWTTASAVVILLGCLRLLGFTEPIPTSFKKLIRFAFLNSNKTKTL